MNEIVPTQIDTCTLILPYRALPTYSLIFLVLFELDIHHISWVATPGLPIHRAVHSLGILVSYSARQIYIQYSIYIHSIKENFVSIIQILMTSSRQGVPVETLSVPRFSGRSLNYPKWVVRACFTVFSPIITHGTKDGDLASGINHNPTRHLGAPLSY